MGERRHAVLISSDTSDGQRRGCLADVQLRTRARSCRFHCIALLRAPLLRAACGAWIIAGQSCSRSGARGAEWLQSSCGAQAVAARLSCLIRRFGTAKCAFRAKPEQAGQTRPAAQGLRRLCMENLLSFCVGSTGGYGASASRPSRRRRAGHGGQLSSRCLLLA